MTNQAKIKTPRDAKGSEALRLLEKTTTSVFQSRIAPKSAENMKHCHHLKASRNIKRIDRRPWENRVGQMLEIAEHHRFNRVNALYHALARVNGLLALAKGREEKLKHLTRELTQTSAYLQTLMDAMVDMLLATDTTGVIIEANLASQRISGFTPKELIGSSLYGFFTDPDRAETGFREVMEKNEIIDYELSMIRKDGSRVPIMCNASLIFEEGSITGVLINARDISELKQAREAQEMYARELARANADLEEFATVTSHDLQEPLKKVAVYAEDLTRRYKDQIDAQAVEDLSSMIDQTVYMRELIQSVLSYAQIDTGERIIETVECDAILDQAMKNLQAALDESGAMVTRDSLPEVRADAGQLVRVFQNLVGNAIKHRDPDKKQCHVHISAERIEKSEIQIPKSKIETGWLFTVGDNGTGIDPDFIEDIFKMFVRLDPDVPGTGLGLSITEKIVRRHGGEIWVESELGEGSTFYFTLQDMPV